LAVYAATDHKITLNGTNLSHVLQSVSLDLSSDELETTAFGGGWRTRVAGLKSGSVTLNFFQDFAAAAVDATLYPLYSNGSYATVVITPTSTATSATNPAYTAVCLVSQYQPFASSVGDIATMSVTWQTNGTVSRATA
jgi:predicted secreted protein